MLNLYEGKILREIVFGIKPDVFNPPKLVYYKTSDNGIYNSKIVAGYYDDDKGKGYGITGEGSLVPNPCELVDWNFSYFCEYLKEHYPEAFTISNSEVFNKNGVLIVNCNKKGPRDTNPKVYNDICWNILNLGIIQDAVRHWIEMKLEKEWDFCYLKSYLMDNYPDDFSTTENAIFNEKGVLIAEASLDHTIALNNCISLSYSSITSSKSVDSFIEFWKEGENVHPDEREELDKKLEFEKIKVGLPEDDDEGPDIEPEEKIKPQNKNLWTDQKKGTVEAPIIVTQKNNKKYWVQYETDKFYRDLTVKWDGDCISDLKCALASHESSINKDYTTDTGYIRIKGIARLWD